MTTNCIAIPLQKPLPPPREEAENLTEEERELLASLKLGTAHYVETRLKSFVEMVIAETRSSKPRTRVFIVRGPWGYGKTFYATALLKRLVEEKGLGWAYYSFDALVEELLKSLSENTNVVLEARRLLVEAFRQALGDRQAAVIFLDELEAALEGLQHGRTGKEQLRGIASRALLDALLDIIRLLMHGEVKEYSELRGRIHLFLAVTPEAHYKLQQLAAEKGVEGRLARREDIITLLPLSRRDTRLLARALLKHIYGLPEDTIHPRIIDVIHVISNGVPATVLYIVNRLLHSSAVLCRSIRGEECICRIDDPLLALKLMSEIEISYTGPQQASTKLVSSGVAQILLRAWSGDAESVKQVARMIVFMDPIEAHYAGTVPLRQIALVLGSNIYYEVNVYEAKADDLAPILSALESRLISKGNEKEIVRRALQLLVDEDEAKRSWRFVLPAHIRDYGEVVFLVSSFDITIDASDVEYLVRQLSSTVRPKRMIALRPTAIPLVYPASRLTAIPFITDPIAARRLLEHISQLQQQSMEAYQDLIVKGFEQLLQELGYAGEARLELRIGAYGTEYAIPLRIATFISHVGSRHPRPVHVTFIVVPPEEEPRLEFDQWAVTVTIPLPYNVQKLLAASAYALSSEKWRDYVDRGRLRDFYEQVAQLIDISEVQDRIAKKLVDSGVLVPPILPGEKYFEFGEGDPRNYVLNSYRFFLLRGGITLEELVEMLIRLYRVRPYARRGKWCGIAIPKLLYLDVEPEDSRDLYDSYRLKRYRERLLKTLSRAARAAIETGILSLEDNVYRPKLHPIEQRIIDLIEEHGGSLDYDRLLDHVLLPVHPEHAARAKTILDSFFLELLEYRGIVERVEGGTSSDRKRTRRRKTGMVLRLIPKYTGENILAKARQSLAETLGTLNIIESRLRELLDDALRECNREQKLTSLPVSDLLALMIAKEKSVKIVTLEALSNAINTVLEHSLMHGPTREFAEFTRQLINIYNTIINKVHKELRRLEDAIDNAVRTYYDTVMLITRTLNINISYEKNPAELATTANKCEVLVKAIEDTLSVINDARTLSPKDFEKTYSELKKVMYYDNCKNDYQFNVFLYVLRKQVDEAVKELNTITKKLDEAKEIIRESISELAKHKYGIDVSEIGGPNRITSIDDVIAIAEKLRELRMEIKSILEECEQAKHEMSDMLTKSDSIKVKLKREIEEANSLIDSLEKSERLLKDLENQLKVGTYIKHYIENLSKTARALRKSITICKNLEELLHSGDEISRLYDLENKPCSQQFSKRARNILSRLRHLLTRLEHCMKELENEANKARNALEQARNVTSEVLVEPLRSRLVNTERLLEIASRHSHELKLQLEGKLEYVREAITELERIAKLEDHEVSPTVVTQIREEAARLLDSIAKRLRSTVKEDIGEEAALVLEKLVEAPEHNKLSSLTDWLARATGLTEETVVKSLYLLDKKGYIRLLLKIG